MRMVPNLVRTIVQRDDSGMVTRWLVTDGEGRREPRGVLSPEEQELPVGSIINHAELVDRLLRGWTPEEYLRKS